ncbi:MAG: carboxyl transferase domain-containing protein, partial [Chloroflexota bacterium]|nr:carboxyl transferase domain-containing protein [Chloroflexota bacterium]
LGWSGPTLVRGGLGEEVGLEELAGAEVHSKTTGLVDVVAADEVQCLNSIKEFLSYMPSSCWELAPTVPTADSPDRECPELLDIVPPDLKKPYDMHRVIATLVDEGKYFPFKKDFGKTVITCLARLNGHSVGLVANQPSYLGGAMDVDGCYKARRFISMCDAFHIPLVFLQDQPGFMVGKEAERQRAVYWGVSLLEAQHRTTVPKLTVILRKSHGAALWAMGGRVSKDNPDLMAAWPLAIMSGTGPQAAVYTIHDKELKSAPDPEGLRRSLEEHYRQWGSVYGAAEVFGIDDIIEPQETRRFLIAGLEMTRAKLKRQLGKRHPVDY